MNRPRILHLRPSNFVGGPEQQLLRYAESERDGTWDVLLGTFVGSEEGVDFLEAIETRGLKAVSLPADALGSSLRALLRVIKQERIALLCAHGYKADILGLLAGRLANIPVACFLRGWTGENRKVRVYEAADRLALHFADFVVCLSASQAEALSGHDVRPEKIHIISNAIDVPPITPDIRLLSQHELRRRFALPPDCAIVATAGRLSREKGLNDFLQAVAHCKSQLQDVRFLIFGTGVLRQQLEDTARSLDVQDRVIFAGFHRDLRSLLPGLDVLVNPSLSEVMPNIVLEGMAAGVPVVATAVGSLEEIAGPDAAIQLAPPGKPEILASAICELLRDPTRASELAHAGRARVEHAYSLAKQRSHFHNLYDEILSSSQPESANVIASHKPVGNPSFACRPAARGSGELPFLSIVIPVRNEASHVGAVLGELEAQDYPRHAFEVLVVDGNSTDGTAKAVEKFAQHAAVSVRLLRNPAQLSSAGRNVGVRNACGEFVIFIDGHCHIPSKTLLRDAVELFETTGADCLCRPQPLTVSSNTLFQDVVAHARATLLGHGRDSTIYATNREGPVNPSSSGALYRRDVFDRVGYYDERFDACEDVEFNFRLFKVGLRSFLSPKLMVFYEARADLKSLWRQIVRYGRGRFRLISKHPDAFSVSQCIPAVFLAWLGIGGLASLFSWRFAELLFITLVTYSGLLLVFSLRLAFRFGWRHLILAPVVYGGIHFGLGAGYLAEMLAAGWRRDPSGRNDLDRASFRTVKSTTEAPSRNRTGSQSQSADGLPKSRQDEGEMERLTIEE
jgi:succinoglycan biosynthesis protein ExoA